MINPAAIDVILSQTLTSSDFTWSHTLGSTHPSSIVSDFDYIEWDELAGFSYLLAQLVWGSAGTSVNGVTFEFKPFDPSTSEGWLQEPKFSGSGAAVIAFGTATWQNGDSGTPNFGRAYLDRTSGGVYQIRLETASLLGITTDRVYIELNFKTTMAAVIE